MNRLRALSALAFLFIKDVALSNLAVARDALRRKPGLDPRVLEVQLGPLTELQAFCLANLITMTPGTLSLDLSEDRRILTIHTIYGQKADLIKRSICHAYEPLVRQAL